MNESAFFQDLAIMMTVAGVVSLLFARFKWPKVLGYIFAGIIMNAHTWGGSFLQDSDTIQILGQLGVIFLMFSMGLSFSARDMRKMRAVALPAAIVDTVVMIWLGYIIGTRIFGWPNVQSLFLGVAICDSATTLLAKVIDEMGWGNRIFTKYVLGTSICEDIICVGAIAVATGCAQGGGMSVGAFAGSLGWLAVFFLSVLVIGFVFVPRLLVSIGKHRDDEELILTALGFIFFVSFFAYHFDFSLALGAFLVGIICASSDMRDRIMTLSDPLKSMFAAMFFVSIGLLVNPAALWGHAPEILLVAAVVMVGKFINTALVSLVTGLDIKSSVQIGFSLAQIGEFAFMVAILYAGITEDAENPLFQIGVGVSLLTTLLSPFMIRVSDKVGDLAVRLTPKRFRDALESYHAWLEKIRSSEDSPAFILLRTAAIKLGVYAVLILAISAACKLLAQLDYSRFSVVFERHSEIIFFCLSNILSFAFLPMILSASRALGDEIAELLTGDGSARWQAATLHVVRFVVLVAVVALFFTELTMINFAIAPKQPWVMWTSIVVTLAIAIAGWRLFMKAGRRATTRFQEALTAEERRDGLVKMMTVSVPEGTIRRFTLDADSPAIGGTVVSLNIRAKTGASIVSVFRNGQITRNIGPEWEFEVGDTLVALGETHQIAALKDLLGITA